MSKTSEGFVVGNVRLTPILGNIMDLQADALVQPSGTSPPGAPVQASPWVIKSDRDHIIAKTLNDHAPLKLGDVIVTSPGTLYAKYLFNAVVIDWAHQHPSQQFVIDEIVSSTARKCIDIAVALGLKSIAFTPWGTRAAGADAARVTAIMLQALASELQERSGDLEVVYLISIREEHYRWFADRAFVFHILFDQVGQVRNAIKELDIPSTHRERLLRMLENLQTNVVVYNEIVGGDKIEVGDITEAAGVAIGKQSSATNNNASQ